MSKDQLSALVKNSRLYIKSLSAFDSLINGVNENFTNLYVINFYQTIRSFYDYKFINIGENKNFK